jgi:predicted acyltransferase (DUF342 family)
MASIDRTRVVVEDGETYDGRVVPTERAEIQRPVLVGEDARVTGGVYGDDITVESGAKVEASVLGATSIEAEDCSFGGELGTPGKIEAADVEVRGSVTGTHVSITGGVVWGNIVGTDVRLEDCTVLGIVTAERSLSVNRTTCYTFKSHGEATVEESAVVLPQAIVDGELDLVDPLQVLGFEIGEGDVTAVEDVALNRDDLVTREDARYLTLAPRVLDLSQVRDRIDALESFLADAVIDGEDHDATWLKEQLKPRTSEA